MIQSGDMRPAGSAFENATLSCEALKKDLERWRKINAERLPAINDLFKQSRLGPLVTAGVDEDPACQH